MADRTAGFNPGQIVTVSAGRETGSRFMVIGLDENFLLLADGRKRTVRKPKRKNPRHVEALTGSAILPAGSLTDEAIRQALRAVQEEG